MNAHDDLGQLFSRLDPARAIVDSRTDDDRIRDLSEVKQGVRLRRASRAWPWIALPSAVAGAAIIAILSTFLSPFGHSPSQAATPPLLQLDENIMTFGEVMERAIKSLRRAPASEPARRAVFEGWYLQADIDEGQASESPQRQEFVWSPDLSGTLVVTAGHAFSDTGHAPPTPDAPGAILQHSEFGVGEAPVLFLDPPPDVAADVFGYLAVALGTEPRDAAEFMDAVRALLSEWTLTPSQHAAILEALSTLPALEVAGDVDDRLGRPGTALRIRSESAPYFQYLIVLSRDSGQILAIETLYVGGLKDYPVEAPAVVDYIAWT